MVNAHPIRFTARDTNMETWLAGIRGLIIVHVVDLWSPLWLMKN